jgi:hypothetical protein
LYPPSSLNATSCPDAEPPELATSARLGRNVLSQARFSARAGFWSSFHKAKTHRDEFCEHKLLIFIKLWKNVSLLLTHPLGMAEAIPTANWLYWQEGPKED